jgi:phosphoglycolate phosphatase
VGLTYNPLTRVYRLHPRDVSVNYMVRAVKPHPEALFLNCQQLQCEAANSIYVGDHERDIEAGRRAGMYTIAATTGYIEPGDNPADWGADASVACSTELHRAIFGH